MLEANGEWFYNLAAATGFIAYLMTNVLWLRVLLVVGACAYIATGIMIGLTSMIGWHVAYAVINLVHVIILIMDKHGTGLPETLKPLYTERFRSIKPREFRRLLATNESKTVTDDIVLEQSQENSCLYLILCGEAHVKLDGDQVTTLNAGEFFGEMSVLSGRVTSSSVTANGTLEIACWSVKDLKNLERKNLSLYNRFMMTVGLNVIDKLQMSTQNQRTLVS